VEYSFDYVECVVTAKSDGPSTVASADVNVVFNLPLPATFADVNATSEDMNDTRAVVVHEGHSIRWILGDSVAPGDEAELFILAMAKGAGSIKGTDLARAHLHKVDDSVSTEGDPSYSAGSLPALGKHVLTVVAAAAAMAGAW